jgi:hypothetical protein
MKVTVNIDCTPDEARQFFGLPDVKPLQAAMLAKLEEQMTQAAAAMSPDALLKAWLGTVPQTGEQMQKAFAAFLNPLFGKTDTP